METNQNLNYIYTHGYHSSTTIAYLYVENEASFCASSERLQVTEEYFSILSTENHFALCSCQLSWLLAQLKNSWLDYNFLCGLELGS